MTKLQAVESIKRNTRRFAKRQMTWFRAENRIIWKSLRHGSDFEQLADEIVHAVRA
jgi:tRNA dimethylallyltransferase